MATDVKLLLKECSRPDIGLHGMETMYTVWTSFAIGLERFEGYDSTKVWSIDKKGKTTSVFSKQCILSFLFCSKHLHHMRMRVMENIMRVLELQGIWWTKHPSNLHCIQQMKLTWINAAYSPKIFCWIHWNLFPVRNSNAVGLDHLPAVEDCQGPVSCLPSQIVAVNHHSEWVVWLQISHAV